MILSLSGSRLERSALLDWCLWYRGSCSSPWIHTQGMGKIDLAVDMTANIIYIIMLLSKDVTCSYLATMWDKIIQIWIYFIRIEWMLFLEILILIMLLKCNVQCHTLYKISINNLNIYVRRICSLEVSLEPWTLILFKFSVISCLWSLGLVFSLT